MHDDRTVVAINSRTSNGLAFNFRMMDFMVGIVLIGQSVSRLAAIRSPFGDSAASIIAETIGARTF